MFGMTEMIKGFLEDQGIDLEQMQREVIEYANYARNVTASMIASQQQITNVLQATLLLQKINEKKIDAILAHLNITVEEEPDNAAAQLAIGFDGTESKPN